MFFLNSRSTPDSLLSTAFFFPSVVDLFLPRRRLPWGSKSSTRALFSGDKRGFLSKIWAFPLSTLYFLCSAGDGETRQLRRRPWRFSLAKFDAGDGENVETATVGFCFAKFGLELGWFDGDGDVRGARFCRDRRDRQGIRSPSHFRNSRRRKIPICSHEATVAPRRSAGAPKRRLRRATDTRKNPFTSPEKKSGAARGRYGIPGTFLQNVLLFSLLWKLCYKFPRHNFLNSIILFIYWFIQTFKLMIHQKTKNTFKLMNLEKIEIILKKKKK